MVLSDQGVIPEVGSVLVASDGATLLGSRTSGKRAMDAARPIGSIPCSND
jgi:hypothetical protein